MAGPWERYQTAPSGPWERFAPPVQTPAPEGPPPAPLTLSGTVGNFNEDFAASAARNNPVSLIIDAINSAPMLLNLLPGEQGMEPFSERPVGGGEAFVDALREYGVLQDNFQPQNKAERYASRIGQEVGAATGMLAAPAARAAQLSARGTRPVDMNLIERAIVAPMMTRPGTAAVTEGASAVGAGAGAQYAADQFGGNEIAEMIGAIIGGTAGPTAIGAGSNIGQIARTVGEMIPGMPQTTAREAAGREIVENASDPTSLDRMSLDASPGVKLSTAQATGDPGLAALERSRAGAENVGKFAQRGVENAAALRRGVDSIAPEGFGDDATRKVLDDVDAQARQEFEAFKAEELRKARERVAAEAAAEQAAAAEAAAAQSAATPPVTRETASRAAADRVTGNAPESIINRFREVRNRLYGEVDQDVPVPTERATTTARGIVDEAGRAGAPPKEISRIARTAQDVDPDAAENAALLREVFGDEVPDEVSQITFGQAKDDLTVLGDAARAAEREGRFGDARKIRMVQDAVRADMEAAEGASEALARANKFEREEYAPRFREGAASDVRRGKLPENEYLAKVTSDPNEADRFIKTAGDDPEAMKAARDYMLGDLTRNGADKLTAPKLTDWLKRNEEVLGRFPKVREEVETIRKQMASGEAGRDAARARLKEAERAVGKVEAMVPPTRDAAIKTYTNEETAAESVASILRGQNSRENVSKIVNMTSGNKEALDGVKRGFVEFFKRQTDGARSDQSGGSLMRPKAASDFLKDYGDHMRIIFRDSPGHVERLEGIVADIKRVDELASTAPIAKLAKGIERITIGGMPLPSVFSRIFAAESGRTSYRFVASEGLARAVTAFREKVGGKAINALLDEALLDPQLAKALAATYNKANDNRASKTITSVLTRVAARAGRSIKVSGENDEPAEDEGAE